MTPGSYATIRQPDGSDLRFDNALSMQKLGRHPTDFELNVYQAACAIPSGQVSTYGEMAKALNTSSRAVGQALRRNPFAPDVPCHRIVKSDLGIGGFSGSQGPCPNVTKKMALLRKEGVQFNDSTVANPKFVIYHTALRHRLNQQL